MRFPSTKALRSLIPSWGATLPAGTSHGTSSSSSEEKGTSSRLPQSLRWSEPSRRWVESQTGGARMDTAVKVQREAWVPWMQSTCTYPVFMWSQPTRRWYQHETLAVERERQQANRITERIVHYLYINVHVLMYIYLARFTVSICFTLQKVCQVSMTPHKDVRKLWMARLVTACTQYTHMYSVHDCLVHHEPLNVYSGKYNVFSQRSVMFQCFVLCTCTRTSSLRFILSPKEQLDSEFVPYKLPDGSTIQVSAHWAS